MIKANRHSIAGVLLAVFCVSVLAGTGILGPIFANGLGKSPRELRLGSEIGLILPSQCVDTYLNKSITKKAFIEKLAIVLDVLGISDCLPETVIQTGIVNSKNLNSTMTRKEAVETMARAAMFLNSKQLFSFTPMKPTNFKDYKIPEKYKDIMGYFQNKFVVRGISNNTFGSNKKLTNREAVYFLFRMYESIASDMMAHKSPEGINFIDISVDHPVMESIKNLTAAGAFDRAILRPSFDGNSYLSIEDLSEIVGGIFDRSGKECDTLRLQSIFSDDTGSFTNRREMVLVLEMLLDTLAPERMVAGKLPYSDVTYENPEHQALIKLAGFNIKPGYSNGIFAAEELVTWFEAVNLLDEVLKYAGVTNSVKKDNLDAPATKEDFERLKNILIMKHAKLRQILGSSKKEQSESVAE